MVLNLTAGGYGGEMGVGNRRGDTLDCCAPLTDGGFYISHLAMVQSVMKFVPES